MRQVLGVLLVLSLAINVYLWRQLDRPFANLPNASPASSPRPEPGSPATAQPLLAEQPKAPRSEEFREWLEQGKYDLLAQALTDALRASPLDPQLLLIEAELMVRTEPLSEATLHYYSLLDLPLPAQHHRDIEERIETLVNNATRQLRQSGSWSILAQFMEPLFQRMPLDKTYARWLAEAYAQQQKPTLTEDVLAALPSGDSAIRRIRRLLNTQPPDMPEEDTDDTPQRQADAIAIALERGRDKYYAHVNVDNQPARLLFDTGASTTAITQSLYETLTRRSALPFIGNFTVNTAAGPIRASMFEVAVITFGPLRFERTPVLVLPPSVLPNADGLLGMNLLRAYHFGIDQQHATLTLSPRRQQTNR